MGLMAGGREKSMGLSIAGRLARLLLVLTSLNITEIVFGLISLMQMTRDRPDPFQYQADAELHGLGGASRDRTLLADPRWNPICRCGLCGTYSQSADTPWSDWKTSGAGRYFHPRCSERIGTSVAGLF